MFVSFSCECGRRLKAAVDCSGKRTRCPGCGRILTVPEASLSPVGAIAVRQPVRDLLEIQTTEQHAHPLSRFGRRDQTLLVLVVVGSLSLVAIGAFLLPRRSETQATPNDAAPVTAVAFVNRSSAEESARPSYPRDRGSSASPADADPSRTIPTARTRQEPVVAASPDYRASGRATSEQGLAKVIPDASKAPEHMEPLQSSSVVESEKPVPPTDSPVESKLPLITAKVSWKFTEGSSGSTYVPPQANQWLSTVALLNASESAWTIWPETIFSEVAGQEALAGGYIPKIHLKTRDACFSTSFLDDAKAQVGSVDFDAAPEDPSGISFRTAVFRNEAGNTLTVSAMQCEAHWRVNDAEQPWRETTLKKGDRLYCSWTYLNASTFKPEVKKGASYRLVHLGPIVFDASDTKGIAYALVARSKGSPAPGKTITPDDVTFMPLTLDALRQEISDSAKPLAWRTQFVLWLWDQPRAVQGADAALIKVFDDPANHPTRMRIAAGLGLLERRSAPALPKLLALASNKDADRTLRKGVLAGLPYLKERGTMLLSGIACDRQEPQDIRETAMSVLTDSGQKGWDIVERLKGDPQVGERAKALLTNRKRAR